MILSIILSCALLLATVFFHYTGLRGVAALTVRYNTRNFFMPPLLMLCIAALHLLEIIIFATVFYVLNIYSDIGGFTKEFSSTIHDYFYFSGANYTTLGMSNFYPQGHFKTLSIIESLTGFMMLTWSATFFYQTAGRLIRDQS